MTDAPKKLSDDDIARIIGNRAIAHLREMYKPVYAATYPSCRLSLRNHIRNDIVTLLRAMRGADQTQEYVLSWAGADEPDESQFARTE
jgi:hypothetical protein